MNVEPSSLLLKSVAGSWYCVRIKDRGPLRAGIVSRPIGSVSVISVSESYEVVRNFPNDPILDLVEIW